MPHSFASGWASHSTHLSFRTGPFLISLETDYPSLLDRVEDLYGDHSFGESGIHSFHVQLLRRVGPRRWYRPQIRFVVDEGKPFEPFPLDHAFPLFEWGLNWCIAMRAHQYLMLHAAVVERGGQSLILPALPGSGKSTLCAALALSGWRLLSDEFGLWNLAKHRFEPLPRAVPLKNESIDVIRAFSPDAHLGPVYPKTRKGDVAHLRPPGDSLARQQESALPRWIVFPRFARGQGLDLKSIPKSQAFVRLAQNSFNYQFLGALGFDALTRILSASEGYSLDFGSLGEAVATIDDLCSH